MQMLQAVLTVSILHQGDVESGLLRGPLVWTYQNTAKPLGLSEVVSVLQKPHYESHASTRELKGPVMSLYRGMNFDR